MCWVAFCFVVRNPMRGEQAACKKSTVWFPLPILTAASFTLMLESTLLILLGRKLAMQLLSPGSVNGEKG